MVNKEIRTKLLSQLAISPQALSQRAARIKSKHGPMTTDEAVYVIAHIEGIDLSRYLVLNVLDRIRSLIPKDVAPQETKLSISGKTLRRAIRRKGDRTSYPLVRETDIEKAYSIGKESYPRLFILENSIRALIAMILSKVKKDWWEELVSKDVQESVQKKIEKEKKYPHRKSRGKAPIDYSDFSDLLKIVNKNMPRFKAIIVNEEWFKTSMNEVYMSRNNVAHSVLLSEEDKAKINTFYTEWERILMVAKKSGLLS